MTLTLPRRAVVDPDELPPISAGSASSLPLPSSTPEAPVLDFAPGREWLRKLNWGLFEKLVESAFERDGFSVDPVPIRLTGRADMVLRRHGEQLLVQCKHWKAWQVGTPTIRELHDVVSAESADGGVVITAGKYSLEAITYADQTGVILLDGDDLLRMAAGAPVLPLATETTSQWAVPKNWTAFGAPTCPLCDSPMLYKRVRAGEHAGMRFWGCPHYPQCRAIREVGPQSAGLPLERPVIEETMILPAVPVVEAGAEGDLIAAPDLTSVTPAVLEHSPEQTAPVDQPDSPAAPTPPSWSDLTAWPQIDPLPPGPSSWEATEPAEPAATPVLTDPVMPALDVHSAPATMQAAPLRAPGFLTEQHAQLTWPSSSASPEIAPPIAEPEVDDLGDDDFDDGYYYGSYQLDPEPEPAEPESSGVIEPVTAKHLLTPKVLKIAAIVAGTAVLLGLLAAALVPAAMNAARLILH